MTGRRTVQVIVSGRVQGVGYRDWTVVMATRLGLDGWVRNRRDGRVEAVFVGPDESVQRMLAACRTGPAAARVDVLQTVAEAPEVEAGASPGFRRLATA